jgi:tetratricopeptide (TPR) repeat protein
VYQAQGNTDKAIADYNKAIELSPNFAGFYANRGNIYQSQGNLQQAIADYNTAIEKNPDDTSSFYNRGLAYYGLEEYAKSLADYSTALNQNPDKEAYDDFLKYFPEKRTSDNQDIRGAIVQVFEDKLNLPKKIAAPVAAAPADAIPPAAAAAVVADTKVSSTPEEDIKGSVNTWLNSWQSGDMATYRSCYDERFESRKMNLDAWIDYKNNVRNRSKNISIQIDDLKISVDGDRAKAVFTQSYSSSLLKDKGTKTLELKKVGDNWKIYREIM